MYHRCYHHIRVEVESIAVERKRHEFRSFQRVESTSDTSIPAGCWVGKKPHLHLCSKRRWLKLKLLHLSLKMVYFGGKTPKNKLSFNSIHLFNQSHLIGKIVTTVSFRENASLHSTSLCSTWDSQVQASLLHGTTGTDVACLPFQPRWPSRPRQKPVSNRTSGKVAQRSYRKSDGKTWWRVIYLWDLLVEVRYHGPKCFVPHGNQFL